MAAVALALSVKSVSPSLTTATRIVQLVCRRLRQKRQEAQRRLLRRHRMRAGIASVVEPTLSDRPI